MGLINKGVYLYITQIEQCGRGGEQGRWGNSIGTHESVELPDEGGQVYFELAVCRQGRTTASPETVDTRAG